MTQEAYSVFIFHYLFFYNAFSPTNRYLTDLDLHLAFVDLIPFTFSGEINVLLLFTELHGYESSLREKSCLTGAEGRKMPKSHQNPMKVEPQILALLFLFLVFFFISLERNLWHLGGWEAEGFRYDLHLTN